MNRIFKINTFILLACAIATILLMVFIVLAYHGQKQLIADIHKKNLQTLAREKARQINSFLELQKERLVGISSVAVFREAVKDPSNPAKVAAAKIRIEELKSTIPRIALFTNEGILFVSESGPTPMDYSQLPYFISKDNKITFVRYYDEFQGKDYYSVLGPIYDREEKNKIIGAIAFDVELDKISKLMEIKIDNTSKNMEVYLVDKSGLLLSGSKYIGQGNNKGVLVQEIKSEGEDECLGDLKEYEETGIAEEHEEGAPEYLNYMGDEVFGAHSYVYPMLGCVIAEEHADEVLGFTVIDFVKNTIKIR